MKKDDPAPSRAKNAERITALQHLSPACYLLKRDGPKRPPEWQEAAKKAC